MFRRSVLCAALLAAACDKPGVAPGLDVLNCPTDGGACSAPGTPGVITGNVVYSGPARGDVVLFLFDKASLPPPDGAGTSAVAIARVAQATLFGNAGAGSIGPFSAPYIFTQVPPDRSYQIRAFIDAAHEFNPFFDFAQQPRAGDPVGGYGTLDPSGQPQLLFLSVAQGQVVSGIGVALTGTLPFDPPSFEVAGALPALDQANDRPQRLRLHTVNLGVPSATFTRAHFGLELDRDAAGARRSSFGDGLDDVFPKVFLRQLLDERGAKVAATDAALIPGRVVPVAQLPLLVAMPPGASPLAVDTLDVLLEPFAVRAATLEPLPVVPKGQYQIVVVERSGQVWTLPNQLGDASRSGTPYYAKSQATALTVDDKQLQALPPGTLSGSVVFQGDPSIKSGNILVQAYLDDPLNRPPPLGAAQPVRVALVRPSQVTQTATGFTARYTLTGLAYEQKYIIEALADVAGTFSPLDLLQTPVRGDLLGGAIDPATGALASVQLHAGGANTQDVTLSPQPVPLDAPAFQIDDAAGPSSMPADQVAPVRFGVTATPLAFPTASAPNPVFTVSLVRDATGKTVDADGDGLPDVWPRVFLVALDPADPTDLTQRAPTQIIPAAVDPTPFLAGLRPQQARPAVPAILTNRLPIIVRPVLVDAATRVRRPLAPGKYKIVIINQTGQAWQIPNEAGPAALDPRAVCAAAPCAPGTVQTQSQGRAFLVGPPTSTPTQVTISGTLSFTGATPAAAYVYAFSAANPPPPYGTGTPVSADYHSALELSSGSVAFSLPNLLGGQSYFVTAVVDTRGDYAVSPLLYAAAPGEGTLVAAAPGPVLAGTTGVTLDATRLPPLPPRPSFTVATDLGSLFPDALTPQRVGLHATQVITAALSTTPEADAPTFPVSYQACAGKVALDVDSDGLPGLYPKIAVVKLADSDPSGLTLDPVLTVIPARVDPVPFVTALGDCNARNVVAATDLSVLLAPVAVQFAPDRTPQQIPIPKGRYGIVLTSSTGQVWRVPNELAPVVPSQAVSITVAAQVPAPLPGSISGTVRLTGYTDAQVGNLVLAAYAAAAPPPPLGLGRPLAVQLIGARAVAPSVSGSAVRYALGNLAPGSYLVTALLDPLDRFSALESFMATPGLGSQVAVSPVITVGSAPVTGKDLSLSRSQPAIPFERPSFVFDATSATTLSAARPSVLVQIDAAVPAGLPYAVSAATLSNPSLHPLLALCPASGRQPQNPNLPCTPGQPFQDTSVTCTGGKNPWVSGEQVVVSPLDTGSRLVAYVALNQCQFCTALTGSADCSAMPLPQATSVSSIVFAVTSTALDPATGMPAGSLPPGHYAVTLVEATGQSWTLPNELAPGAVFTVTP